MHFKRGFTIIELMITITIIILMTVLAIPAFSRYEKNSEYNQKISEISSLLEEYNLRVKNPEIGAKKYEIHFNVNSKTIEVYKDNDMTNAVKQVILPSDYVLSVNTPTTRLICVVGAESCETKSDTITYDQAKYNSLFRISGPSPIPTTTFNIKTKPFSIKVQKNG